MASTALGVLSGLQAVNALGGSIAQAKARKAQAEYESSSLLRGMAIKEREAQDAISRGNIQALSVDKAVQSNLASQQVARQAGGISSSTGSSAAMMAESLAAGEVDKETIRANAFREAFGYRSQAREMAGQRAMSGIAAKYDVKNTLLTGGLEFLQHGIRAGYYFGKDGGKPKEDKPVIEDKPWKPKEPPKFSVGRGFGAYGRD